MGNPELSSSLQHWRTALAEPGFAFVPAISFSSQLAADNLVDWQAFAASWERLEIDRYMADQGRYRRRRHAVFQVGPQADFVLQPHQAHFQALQYNPLHGDLQRWFEPIEPGIVESASLRCILALAHQIFVAGPGRAAANTIWQVEVHQFRIEATSGQAGKPTPEGVHRDGVDWVLVLMIQRRNIAAGSTTIHDLDGHQIGSFTLREPLDAALVDDHRCFHGVTAVHPLDPSRAAHRDVLVVTFKARQPCFDQHESPSRPLP